MTNQVIPAEAVEAAAKAVEAAAKAVEAAAKAAGLVFDEPANSRDIEYIRLILEAAAPYMLAEAWDRGMSFSAALLNGDEYTPSFRKDNPYRPTP